MIKTQEHQTEKEKLIEIHQVGLLICIMCIITWSCFFFFGSYGRVFKGRYLLDPRQLIVTKGIIVLSTSGGGKEPSYRIEYEYVVEHQKYRSDIVNFGPTAHHDQEFSRSYLEMYPVGKPVKVFYYRNDPTVAVLEPNVYRADKFDLAFEVSIPVTLLVFTSYFAFKIKLFKASSANTTHSNS